MNDINFKIVDSDILIEELLQIEDGQFIKGENKILKLIDYFIYNKNVFLIRKLLLSMRERKSI